MSDSYKNHLAMLKALSDETRLKIIERLSCGTLCACEILEPFQITQPTLSYHMKQLATCQLVRAERIGAWMYYTLETERYQQLLDFMAHLVIPNPESIRVPTTTCCVGNTQEAK